jgi:pimeloyl-ACP methyl ester carboxylesterase
VTQVPHSARVAHSVFERDLALEDGRNLHVYDAGGPQAADALTGVWLHGSPQTGAPLEPLVSAAVGRGIRLLSYGRPSYGGSSPQAGRQVASAAADVAQLADAFGVPSFAVMGYSGGGPHALACAGLMAGRVTGVVSLASLAPFTGDFDWFAGMVSDGALRAAVAGREARARYAASAEFGEDSFTPADWAALSGAWASLGEDAGRAGAAGPDGEIDDDVAFAHPWGFDVAMIEAPVLLVQGGQDRIVPPAHADWLVRHCRRPELWLRPHDGHVSILEACPLAMDWLTAQLEGR